MNQNKKVNGKYLFIFHVFSKEKKEGVIVDINENRRVQEIKKKEILKVASLFWSSFWLRCPGVLEMKKDYCESVMRQQREIEHQLKSIESNGLKVKVFL